jgi:hypothetical protein
MYVYCHDHNTKGEYIFDQWVVYTYVKEGPQLKGVKTIAKYETSCKKIKEYMSSYEACTCVKVRT